MRFKNEVGDDVEIDARNVGSKNPKATIQIEVIILKNNRRRFFSISIPEEYEQEFIDSVTRKES